MKLYKSVLNGGAPFVLCKQTVGQPYTWANENRAGTRAIDLPKDDALILAKFLKLDVIEFANPERLHVVGILRMADLDKEKAGIKPRFVGVSRIGGAHSLDKVNGAIGGDKLFALNGCAHEKSLCCDIAESGYIEKYLSKPEGFMGVEKFVDINKRQVKPGFSPVSDRLSLWICIAHDFDDFYAVIDDFGVLVRVPV